MELKCLQARCEYGNLSSLPWGISGYTSRVVLSQEIKKVPVKISRVLSYAVYLAPLLSSENVSYFSIRKLVLPSGLK